MGAMGPNVAAWVLVRCGPQPRGRRSWRGETSDAEVTGHGAGGEWAGLGVRLPRGEKVGQYLVSFHEVPDVFHSRKYVCITLSAETSLIRI